MKGPVARPRYEQSLYSHELGEGSGELRCCAYLPEIGLNVGVMSWRVRPEFCLVTRSLHVHFSPRSIRCSCWYMYKFQAYDEIFLFLARKLDVLVQYLIHEAYLFWQVMQCNTKL